MYYFYFYASKAYTIFYSNIKNYVLLKCSLLLVVEVFISYYFYKHCFICYAFIDILVKFYKISSSSEPLQLDELRLWLCQGST